MRLLAWLREHLRRPAFNSEFAVKGPPADPRTIALPMSHGHEGHTYYEVAEMWARERLRFKRQMLARCEGDSIEPSLDSPYDCDFGMWLRFVNAEGDLGRALDDLRMWHDHWHAASALLLSATDKHMFDLVRDNLSATNGQTRGAWLYASRKVDRLLEKLWA